MKPTNTEQITLSAQQLIKEAKKNTDESTKLLLVKASQQLLLEENYQKALWLSAHLLTLEQSPKNQYLLNIVAAKAYYEMDNVEKVREHLETALQIKNDNQLTHTTDYYQLTYQLALQNEQPVLANHALLHIVNSSTNTTADDINDIWQRLQHFSPWQLTQLLQLAAPNVEGWVALARTTNKYGGQSDLSKQLSIWQKNFPTHPANVVVPELAKIEQQPITSFKNVAVMLPLTGRQSAAGIAAQQGIIASLGDDQSISLTFIDTNTADFTLLTAELINQQTDFIIGPLLKENVSKLLQLEDLTIPTLLLNIPEQLELKEHQFALSMRPEDEAVQAATILSNKNYQQPIILSHKDKTSERISNAFVKTWQALTQQSPQVIYFEPGAKMQDVLKNTLAVNNSQKRIKALKYRIRETIKTEARSRRDIDMIYIVGTPKQTRLLKPYIDVNTSPFADIIPVFASSRSHTNIIDDSTFNDLRGLSFTQIPFLLTSKQQNKALANTAKKIWPQRSDSLQRIFAMGFDSLKIINKLKLMKSYDFIRHFGQTGTLKLNQQNILTRSLVWGNYQRKKVIEIAME